MSLACLGEATGYGGRIALYFFPFFGTPFQIQICCLIISPVFNSAAVYLVLKHIVEVFGTDWSILNPKGYTQIFITADVISLVLQGTGGGLSATAIENPGQANLGSQIMIAGVSFQVVTLFLFSVMATTYALRRWHGTNLRPLTGSASDTWQDGKFRFFVGGTVTAFITIFIRCVYRIIEMKGGWRNPIMRDEITFIVLDGWYAPSRKLLW